MKCIVSSWNLPIYKLKRSPKVLYIGHVFNSMLKFLCWKKERKYFYNAVLEYRILRCHYSLCHTKSEAKLLESVLKYYKIDDQHIIKSGYPSFDRSWQIFNDIENKQIGLGDESEYLLVAPSHIGKFLDNKIMFEMILKMLKNGINIILRGHPMFINSEKSKYSKYLKVLEQHKGFILDDGNREKFCNFLKIKKNVDSIEALSIAMYKSFALLCDTTSLAYTYPFVALKPCVVYLENPSEVGIEVDGISAYNKIMHFVVHDAESVYESVCQIKNKINKQEYSNAIKKIRDNEVYHIGNSAKFIAEKVKEILRDNNELR